MLGRMSETSVAETRRLGVETTGIEIIDEAERTARPRDLFWPWFAANVSVFGISYAAFVLGFGISFWQAVLVTVVGGASLCIDLSQPLARMGQPRGPRTDRLTVQLLPRCESNETHVSNIRPRRVEVVVL